MARIAIVLRRENNKLLWNVEATGTNGWLWVNAKVMEFEVLNEGRQGYSFFASGEFQPPYPPPGGSVRFRASVGDFATAGYHGLGPQAEGTLQANETSTSAENSD
jgi:hypothetical protein